MDDTIQNNLKIINEISNSPSLNNCKINQLSDLTNHLNNNTSTNPNSNESKNLTNKQKEMNKYRKDLMFLPLNQQSVSSPKKRKYNQWMNDILTPITRDDCTLQTPDLNKCSINTPEEELILNGFKLPSTPNTLPQSFLLSPLLLSPNLHSPTLAKLFDSFNESKLGSSLFDSPINNLNFNLNNILQKDKSEAKSQMNLTTNQEKNAITNNDKEANMEKIRVETVKEITDNKEFVTVNVNLNNKQINTSEQMNESQMNKEAESPTVNQTVIQTGDDSPKCHNENNLLAVKKFVELPNIQTLGNSTINNSLESNVHPIQQASNNFNNSFLINSSANLNVSNVYSNNQILNTQRENSPLITRFVTNTNQYYPIQSNYVLNRNGFTINNQLNHFYNNQFSEVYNQPITSEATLGNCIKNVNKYREFTNSANCESNNGKKNAINKLVKIEDKIEDKKAKNRAAASRCRQRKQERVNNLEEQVRQLNAENMKLLQSQTQLIQINNHLKYQLFFHTKNGCNLMDYNNNCKMQNRS